MSVETKNFEQEPAKVRECLRKAMLAKRRALSPAFRNAASELAQRFLLESSVWRNARVVFLYCATRNELDTRLLLSAALCEKKTLLLPKCAAEQPGVMRAVRCSALEHLVPGAFGIPEPEEVDNECSPDMPEPALIVVPGVVFDRLGGRLGYGGGYYDRFIAKIGGASALVGLAYAFQVVDTLPLEPWDRRVHALCLDTGFFPCPAPENALIQSSGDSL